jgi:hypothetical protein
MSAASNPPQSPPDVKRAARRGCGAKSLAPHRRRQIVCEQLGNRGQVHQALSERVGGSLLLATRAVSAPRTAACECVAWPGGVVVAVERELLLDVVAGARGCSSCRPWAEGS